MDWPLGESSTPEEVDFWFGELARERRLSQNPLPPSEDLLMSQRMKQAVELGAKMDHPNLLREFGGQGMARVFWSEPATLRMALSLGADPNSRDGQGRSAFHELALHGSRHWSEALEACAVELIKAGANLNAIDAKGRPPLAFALSLSSVFGGSLRAALELLALGADASVADDEGRPLWLGLAQKLLSTDPRRAFHGKLALDAIDDPARARGRGFDLATVAADWTTWGGSVLPQALAAFDFEAGQGHFDVADALSQRATRIAEAAGVDARGQDGWTPLASAAAHGHLRAVELLLGMGADLESRSPEGFTPLMAAAWNGCSAVVSRLLSAGSRLDALDDQGRSALDLAIEYGGPKCEAAVEILELEALVPKVSTAPSKRRL